MLESRVIRYSPKSRTGSVQVDRTVDKCGTAVANNSAGSREGRVCSRKCENLSYTSIDQANLRSDWQFTWPGMMNEDSLQSHDTNPGSERKQGSR